ncbi:hypothetical protein T09_5720 [Trichinella sp. T9]|nr:hypothetical protein T09_5720 [Trichinella sp. T9]
MNDFNDRSLSPEKMEATYDYLNMHLRALGLLDPDVGNIRQVSIQVLIELSEYSTFEEYSLNTRVVNAHFHKIPGNEHFGTLEDGETIRSVFPLLNAKSWRRPFGSRKPKPSFSCATFQHLWRTITHYYYVILSLPDSVAPDVDDLLEPVGDIPLRNVEEPHSGTLRRIG